MFYHTFIWKISSYENEGVVTFKKPAVENFIKLLPMLSLMIDWDEWKSAFKPKPPIEFKTSYCDDLNWCQFLVLVNTVLINLKSIKLELMKSFDMLMITLIGNGVNTGRYVTFGNKTLRNVMTNQFK